MRIARTLFVFVFVCAGLLVSACSGNPTDPSASSQLSPNFTYRDIRGKPLTVYFADTSRGEPVKWDWDFGDGLEHDTRQNPAHRFPNYGNAATFMTSLTITDTNGKTASLQKAVRLSVPAELVASLGSIDSDISPIYPYATEIGSGPFEKGKGRLEVRLPTQPPDAVIHVYIYATIEETFLCKRGYVGACPPTYLASDTRDVANKTATFALTIESFGPFLVLVNTSPAIIKTVGSVLLYSPE